MMELIHAYHGSRTVTTEDFESLVGEAITEQGPRRFLGFSQVSEDEFEEADPLGKQSLL